MRTFKKTLCLVLAVACVLSLCTFGAGAAFDGEEITYTDAVNTMAGLGILEGYEDGSFQPAGAVTRAAAAKLVAFMMLGPDSIKSLPAKQVFDDVPADHWAASYIFYCQLKGIINGMGDGTFAPNAPVTAQALFKMLLAAAGYGKNGEFVGAGWDFNVIEEAMDNNLFKNTKNYEFDKAANREEAALYVYNALMNLEQVKYSKDAEDYEALSGKNTFKQTAWGMQEATGILTANKLTGDTKGAVIGGNTYAGDTTTLAQIGHEMKVWFRDVNGTNTMYFVEDDCTEVARKTLTTKNSIITGGAPVYTDYVAAAAPMAALPAATGDVNTYVLNEKGDIIGVKTPATYQIAKLAIDKKTGKGTINSGTIEVVYAEDMKSGDIVTVKQTGTIYTAYANSVVKGEQITQSATTLGATKYNNGAYALTGASAVTGLSLGLTDAKANFALAIGSNYDLYLDAEGKVYAWSAYSAPADNMVFFVYGYQKPVVSEYNVTTTQNFAQCVDSTGAMVNYMVDKNMVSAAQGVYSVKASATVPNAKTLTAAAATEAATGVYTPADPRLIADANTVFVQLTNKAGTGIGTAEGLVVKLGAKPATNAGIFYTFTANNAGVGGTVATTTMNTVWFSNAAAVPAAKNSYIYVASPNVVSSALYEGQVHNYYNAYVDGEKLDLHYAQALAGPTAGFKTYTEKDGAYALTDYANVVDVTLTAANTNVYVLGDKLYIFDGSALKNYDLAGAKIVNLVSLSAFSFESAAELVDLVNAGEYNVAITFAANPTATPNAYTVGGSTIYVTAIPEVNP